MKLYAVHNEDGEILAAVPVAPTDVVWPTPRAPEGAYSAEIEIPEHLEAIELYELCTQYVVERRVEGHRLVRRDRPGH
jgi:hypothetical protein